MVFKLIEGEFAQTNSRVEVLMDDMRFPSYASSKIKSRHHRFDESMWLHRYPFHIAYRD